MLNERFATDAGVVRLENKDSYQGIASAMPPKAQF
jgi:hypothetical protein